LTFSLKNAKQHDISSIFFSFKIHHICTISLDCPV
jgi:hypothetical protein